MTSAARVGSSRPRWTSIAAQGNEVVIQTDVAGDAGGFAGVCRPLLPQPWISIRAPRLRCASNIVADMPGAIDTRPQQIAAHRKLVQEAYALFGAPHFDRYEFLLALSDHFGDIGLEHHRSSENRRPPGYFFGLGQECGGPRPAAARVQHSWNGKFRRPGGPDDARFQRADARLAAVGLRGSHQLLQACAGGTLRAVERGVHPPGVGECRRQHGPRPCQAAPGATWRTRPSNPSSRPAVRFPGSHGSAPRTITPKVELLWLDVDTRIRELTGDKRSLDDFTHAFFGIDAGAAGAAPYTLARYRAGSEPRRAIRLGGISQRAAARHGPGAPLDGLARGGWKLAYTDAPRNISRSLEDNASRPTSRTRWALSSPALNLAAGGGRWGGPAYEAGLTVGTRSGRRQRP